MSKKLQIGILVGLLALFAGLSLVMPVETYLGDFVAWVQQAGAWGGVVFGLVYVVGVIFFIPGTLMSLAAGFLFGLLWGSIVVLLAATVGAALSFLIGRFLVRDWIANRVEDYPRFHALYRAIEREGFKTVALSRLVPIFPFALVNYGFSATKVGFWRYVFASWLGIIPATVVYVYLGTFVGNLARLLSGEVEESPLQNTLFIVGGAAAVLVTVVLTRQAKKELEKLAPEVPEDQSEAQSG